MRHLKMLFLGMSALALMSVGCTTEDPTSTSTDSDVSQVFPFLKFTTPASRYGSMVLSNQRYGDDVTTNVVTSGSADIKGTNNWNDTILVDAGALTIHGKSISHDTVTGGYHTKFSSSPPSFGTTSTWSLAGDTTLGVPGFTTTLTMPTEILLTGPTADSLSLASLPTVTWNADASNPKGKIAIVLSTFGSNPEKHYILTDDDGSYTLTSSDVSFLSSGDALDIDVVRGNDKYVGTNDDYYIFGYTDAVRSYRVVN